MLSQEEIDQCREAFEKFDKDGSGTIDMWELKTALQAMGQNPTEEELFQMISQVDDDGSGAIEFSEFLKVIENQKHQAENQDDDADTLDAWISMGGNPDKSGCVDADKLRKVIRDFGLTIDIDKLIDEVDEDRSGKIEYDEFKCMLSGD